MCHTRAVAGPAVPGRVWGPALPRALAASQVRLWSGSTIEHVLVRSWVQWQPRRIWRHLESCDQCDVGPGRPYMGAASAAPATPTPTLHPHTYITIYIYVKLSGFRRAQRLSLVTHTEEVLLGTVRFTIIRGSGAAIDNLPEFGAFWA